MGIHVSKFLLCDRCGKLLSMTVSGMHSRTHTQYARTHTRMHAHTHSIKQRTTQAYVHQVYCCRFIPPAHTAHSPCSHCTLTRSHHTLTPHIHTMHSQSALAKLSSPLDSVLQHSGGISCGPPLHRLQVERIITVTYKDFSH